MSPSHNAFHATVKTVKDLAARGDKEKVLKVIHEELEKEAEETFARFGAMLAVANKPIALREQLERQGMTVCLPARRKAMALLDELVRIKEDVAAQTTAASAAQGTILKGVTLASMITGVVAAMGMGFLISRGITRALRRISATLSTGAEQTPSAAYQVCASSQSLAEGASEQAASLEETSSSLEEMSSMTRRNAENAGQVKDLGSQARAAGDVAVTDMQAMGAAMDAIKISSDDIAKIIKTIDETAMGSYPYY